MSQGEIRRARQLLAALIHLSNKSRKEIDDLLLNCRGQTSQMITGRVALKYEHIVRVLEVLDVDPGDFFRTLYPKSGDRGLASAPVLKRYLEAMDRSGDVLEEPEPAPAAPVVIDPDELERRVRAAMQEALAGMATAARPAPQPAPTSRAGKAKKAARAASKPKPKAAKPRRKT
ncbi:MAG TPA: hypothetical protein VN783_01215 [Thermoanaerobaculia bacterium]|nr:hypothetical protein [Thermoanaerobaculia bacterium]